MPPIVATMRMPCRYVFYHDAARRVATVFEKWNFLIETYLRKKGKSPQKIESIRAFRRGFFLEYGGLKPILPFLGGRSDAARRVVIPLYAISVYARMGINDGRWQCPAMPTVGAGSSQREDSPARRLHRHHGIPCALHASHLWESMVFITPRWLGRALARGRATFGPPLQHRPYRDPY